MLWQMDAHQTGLLSWRGQPPSATAGADVSAVGRYPCGQSSNSAWRAVDRKQVTDRSGQPSHYPTLPRFSFATIPSPSSRTSP